MTLSLVIEEYLSSLFDRVTARLCPTLLRPRPVRGLPNLGNTCYLNAAFGALYFTFQNHEFAGVRSPGPVSTLLSEFMDLFQYRNWTQSASCVRKILRFLPNFNDRQQHCSAAFLVNLLKVLDSESIESGRSGENIRNSGLHRLFSVPQTLVLTCLNCKKRSKIDIYSRILQLPIPNQYQENGIFFSNTDFFSYDVYKYYSIDEELYGSALQSLYTEELPGYHPQSKRRIPIQKCFEYHCRAHLMHMKNSVLCEKCGCETPHYKQTFISHIGTILVLHLQRYDAATGRKMEAEVYSESEIVDLRGFGEELGRYGLRAVVRHYGSLGGGHYMVNVKTEEGWWEINDSHIRPISREELYAGALLLYYRRLGS